MKRLTKNLLGILFVLLVLTLATAAFAAPEATGITWLDWILAHKEELIGIVTGIVTVASIIAKLTPSETDNKVLAYVLKLIDKLALNTKPSELKERLK